MYQVIKSCCKEKKMKMILVNFSQQSEMMIRRIMEQSLTQFLAHKDIH